MLNANYSSYTGNDKIDDDFYTGAKYHSDGFPVNITWVDSKTDNEKDMEVQRNLSCQQKERKERWEIVDYFSQQDDYSSNKIYNIGDTCIYKNYKFKAIKIISFHL